MSHSLPSMDAYMRRLQAALVARIGTARYQLWFDRHAVFVPNGSDLLVGVQSTHFQEWLEQTFGSALREAAEEVSGPACRVRFVVDPSLFEVAASPVADQSKPKAEAKPDRAEPTSRKTLFGDELVPPPSPREKRSTKPTADRRGGKAGRRWKSLSDFVVGACNRVAHASALSVVEDPAQGANPLVFHGPVGTGKTHLLEGVYHGLRKQWPELRPCFVTAEEFTTRFVQSARFGKQGAFRRQFRDCSALLLDDLNFLATKRGTQEEFLHTFDSLIADGMQVVVTMDCHPRLAEELMPELTDRLLGGAIWSLLPPDDETRLDILRNKSAGSPSIPEEVLKFLARNLKGNVRELEGAVHSVRHYANVTGKPVDTALAREALGDLLRHTVRAVTIADVDAAVCGVLNLNSGVLQSKAKAWTVSHPRMLAIYLARKHTSATYGEIAKHFGVKTHSTAVASEKRVRAWITKDHALSLGDRVWKTKDLLDRIERELAR